MDESGFYLLPGVVRTYSPRGRTPVLVEWQTRDHLAVMGGCTPSGQLYVLVREEALNGEHSIEFLRHLLRQAGQRNNSLSSTTASTEATRKVFAYAILLE